MEYRALVDFLGAVGRLRTTYRHCWTAPERRESVSDHSWRLAVMALLCRDEYPELDMDRVLKMCLIHDFGEALTGDIPSFFKTGEDELREESAIADLLSTLPEGIKREFSELFEEMARRETPEAKLWKALDNLEAVVSHNESPLDTWIPLEYTENLVYGQENAAFSPWTAELQRFLRRDAEKKIENGV